MQEFPKKLHDQAAIERARRLLLSKQVEQESAMPEPLTVQTRATARTRLSDATPLKTARFRKRPPAKEFGYDPARDSESDCQKAELDLRFTEQDIVRATCLECCERAACAGYAIQQKKLQHSQGEEIQDVGMRGALTHEQQLKAIAIGKMTLSDIE